MALIVMMISWIYTYLQTWISIDFYVNHALIKQLKNYFHIEISVYFLFYILFAFMKLRTLSEKRGVAQRQFRTPVLDSSPVWLWRKAHVGLPEALHKFSQFNIITHWRKTTKSAFCWLWFNDRDN